MKPAHISMHLFVLVLIATFMMNGCASIICGGKQEIGVNSEPSDCQVSVSYEGRRAVTLDVEMNTPTVLELPRWAKYVRIRVEKEGYRPQEVMLIRTINGWLFANLLIGGVVGIAVDFLTGAAYTLTPEQVDATLEKLNEQGKTLDDLMQMALIIVQPVESL